MKIHFPPAYVKRYLLEAIYKRKEKNWTTNNQSYAPKYPKAFPMCKQKELSGGLGSGWWGAGHQAAHLCQLPLTLLVPFALVSLPSCVSCGNCGFVVCGYVAWVPHSWISPHLKIGELILLPSLSINVTVSGPVSYDQLVLPLVHQSLTPPRLMQGSPALGTSDLQRFFCLFFDWLH